MPLILSGNVASAAAGAYEVANSCMFNAADSVRLYKTGSTGNRRTWTWSCWLKRCTLGGDGDHLIFGASSDDFSTDYLDISFTSADKINIQDYQGSEALRYLTTRVFRDVSAWMNIVIRVDTTQGTASNRLRIYINGVEETAFDTETDPSEDAELLVNKNVVHQVGGRTGAYGGLYMAECVLIDGSSLAPTSFGEFNSDSPTIWQPIDVSGLTFGTNGFYLDFEASDNLGNDANGGTDLTEDNLAATDSSTDSPTNNFATLNPLDHYYNATTSTGGTLSEGSTKFVIASGNKGFARSTIGVTAGKWYWECKLHAVSKGFLGVCNNDVLVQDSTPQHNAIYLYEATPDFRSGDQILTTGVASISTNDIMNFALDMDNYAFYIGVNNSWMNSGDPTSGSNKTGAISELFTTGSAIISGSGAMFANLLNTSTSGGINTSMNFGCPPYANSSDAADANGFGAFEFSPPSGYLALCTKNLGSDGG